jgi:hypothetical protein
MSYKAQITFTILHSLDGYDEISLTSPTKIITIVWKECYLTKSFDIVCHKMKSKVENHR